MSIAHHQSNTWQFKPQAMGGLFNFLFGHVCLYLAIVLKNSLSWTTFRLSDVSFRAPCL